MSMKVETKWDRDLHRAAAVGSTKLLQKTLNTGKVHIDCQDEEGITPLMLATANHRVNCVQILLKEGAEPHLKSNDGTSAIFLAARCGYSSVLSMLLQSLPTSTSSFPNFLARNDGITPLMMAAAMNHEACVDTLLTAGFDPNEESKIGSTPLFHACLRGHVKVAKRLLEDPRTCLSLLKNGESCLHAAAISGNPQLVSQLMEKGADPHLANVGGHTPPELLIMFINYGNIALTPNLLQVLNMLPAIQEKVQTSEGWQQLKKLVRIYCPFNSNLKHRETLHCSLRRKKKKTENSLAQKSKSLHSSPTPVRPQNHVRFTPEIEEKFQEEDDGQRIQRAYCRLLTIQELFQAMKQSPKRISISRHQPPRTTTNGIKNGI